MSSTQPNIVFVIVDELRYPVHFPASIGNADEFMARFMPNLYRLLWSPGVRFDRYYTSASDCTPARATIVTGLYSQQTCCMTTRANPVNPQSTGAPQPPLDPAFPTYGKLLREAGYDMPYIGKWHLSNSPAGYDSSAAPTYLRNYGFDGMTMPDPLGLQGQGIGATVADLPPVGSTPPIADSQIAGAALNWLQARAAQNEQRPFCLTLSFVNPHDKQFFWGGIEANRYNQIYQAAGAKPPAAWPYDIVPQMYPPALGYSAPDNLSPGTPDEPRLHQVFREVTNGLLGAVSHDPADEAFKHGPNPIPAMGTNAIAPYAYWAKSLDMYTQAMSAVDAQIGQVIQNIPAALRDNTVVVFTADHGEYSSSHGMQGKGMSVYQECLHVPFCFTDFTGRYAQAPGVRSQMGSHVDLLPLFANLAFGGPSWMQLPAYQGMYEGRNDLLAAIRDPQVKLKRNYCLYAADEVIAAEWNYLKAPEHVLGYVDATRKFGMYSYWSPGSAVPQQKGQELEYYDYREDPRQLELQSMPQSAAARALSVEMNSTLLTQELQAPLPQPYQAARTHALAAYWKYVAEATVADSLQALMR